jgi:hypothetical protein
MKFAIVLLLCLAAGSQANFLDDLKGAFSNIGTALTNTAHAVGDQAKVVGQNLLSTAAEQGKQLASQALQSERFQKLLAFSASALLALFGDCAAKMLLGEIGLQFLPKV